MYKSPITIPNIFLPFFPSLSPFSFLPFLFSSPSLPLPFRWTGSNTNPNNAGQGKAGTDRSNIVLLSAMNFDVGNGMAVANSPKHGHWGNSYPAHLGDNETFLGWSREDRQTLAVLDNGTSMSQKFVNFPHNNLDSNT